MKMRQALSEFRGMEMQALDERLKEARTELFNLHFQSATGQLENHREIRSVRRQIAQILTVIHGRKLGFEQVVITDPATPKVRRVPRAAAATAEALEPEVAAPELAAPEVAAPAPAEAAAEAVVSDESPAAVATAVPEAPAPTAEPEVAAPTIEPEVAANAAPPAEPSEEPKA
jgi:ribosomal protein L29